jgi:hypothetical protein
MDETPLLSYHILSFPSKKIHVAYIYSANQNAVSAEWQDYFVWLNLGIHEAKIVQSDDVGLSECWLQ